MSNGIFDYDDPKKTDDWQGEKPAETEPFLMQTPSPSTNDETIRRSGLAWSAGIVFFSSIVFMMFLGWIADLLLGSSPWGIVAGVVLGSVMGFIQFFRITSQIFSSKKSGPSEHPLMSRDNDEK